MGRPRKPSKLLELTGAYKKDPKRRRAEPVAAGVLGEAPGYFSGGLREIWQELEAAAPAGVLTNADRWLVELACALMFKLRTDGLTPGVGMTGAELSQLVACLARMGMTPADRSRVGVGNKKAEPDEFAALALESGFGRAVH
jgi:hypothetical protein